MTSLAVKTWLVLTSELTVKCHGEKLTSMLFGKPAVGRRSEFIMSFVALVSRTNVCVIWHCYCQLMCHGSESLKIHCYLINGATSKFYHVTPYSVPDWPPSFTAEIIYTLLPQHNFDDAFKKFSVLFNFACLLCQVFNPYAHRCDAAMSLVNF